MIDSRSSGERNGKSLNRCVCKCCSVYASGLWDLSSDHATGLAHDQSRTERNWKVRPERVIAPYVKVTDFGADEHPSTTGHVEPCWNLRGPPRKAKYYSATDSEQVP